MPLELGKRVHMGCFSIRGPMARRVLVFRFMDVRGADRAECGFSL